MQHRYPGHSSLVQRRQDATTHETEQGIEDTGIWLVQLNSYYSEITDDISASLDGDTNKT